MDRAELYGALKRRWEQLGTERPDMSKDGRDTHVAHEYRGHDEKERQMNPPEWFKEVANAFRGRGRKASPRTVKRARLRRD